ncbi:MAG: nuclear transport factor 2 family protein [Gemmatimonadota bacterium]|nr:nuclear transport factor 2 family protein [Gemmatimonadota bacterium]
MTTRIRRCWVAIASKRNVRIAFACAALIPAVSRAQAPDPVAAINATLDAFHRAASKADGATYFGLFARNGVFIGTDASERWTVEQFRAYADPHFSKGQGWTYVPRSRRVVIADIPCRCAATFDEILDSSAYGTTRGTGTLVLENGEWKIAQYALTIPVPNDLARKIVAEIRESTNPVRH